MKPFSSSLELSKYVNGLLVWGPFSYLEQILDPQGNERATVILLEVDFDGVQHFATVYADHFEFIYANHVAAGHIDAIH